MTYSDEYAFPCPTDVRHEIGLSKREYFAAFALQGLLVNQAPLGAWDDRPTIAVRLADKLIDALNDSNV